MLQVLIDEFEPGAVQQRHVCCVLSKGKHSPFNLVRKPDVILVAEREILRLLIRTCQERKKVLRDTESRTLQQTYPRPRRSPCLEQRKSAIRRLIITDSNLGNGQSLRINTIQL